MEDARRRRSRPRDLVVAVVDMGLVGRSESPRTGTAYTKRTNQPRPRALDCGRSFSSSSRDPNQNSTPERTETLLGPSQGASQLNQTTQRL
ncbi:hypothetical protein PGT21_001232 [Puccinia graminis f. sp. tritici]|uniref:Uncharacterized protein n=1 Tax=Puccinia graminis f. sp. tritici TaxID=56615 RepID=A0A5B0MSW6_PUCGR|nr:hypothetical protein PGTUg99_005085 [Puccinia graminis f. sp. tritici]KAA1103809.1 hypothetical protein PGT21_001232 [Puccinia graminis f. sp. tritici]